MHMIFTYLFSDIILFQFLNYLIEMVRPNEIIFNLLKPRSLALHVIFFQPFLYF